MAEVFSSALGYVLGWLGLGATACGFWLALSPGAIEADPDGTMHTAAQHLTAQLAGARAAIVWAERVDALGAAWMRRATGWPPDPALETARWFGGSELVIRVAVHQAVAETQALPRGAGRSVPAQIGSAVERAVQGFAVTLREQMGLEPPAKSPDQAMAAAAAVGRALTALGQARDEAAHLHLGLRRVLVRTVVWTLAADSVLVLGLTAVAALFMGYWRRPAADALRMPPASLRPQRLALLPAAAAPGISAALVGLGVPEPVARDLAAWLGLNEATPGSLRGHDRVAGGLYAHVLHVTRVMRELTAEASGREQALGATLAAAHDLGKLFVYQQDAYGTWNANTGVPHDSLSAQVLALCPHLGRSFGPQEVEDLLLATHAQHAPELLPVNVRPRVGRLLEWLKEADTRAARKAAGASIDASTLVQ